MTNLFAKAAKETTAKKATAKEMMLNSVIKEADAIDKVRRPYINFLKTKGLQALFGIVTYKQLIERLTVAQEVAEEAVARASALGISVISNEDTDELRQYKFVVEGEEINLYNTRNTTLMEDEEYASIWQRWMDATIPSIDRINRATSVGAINLIEGLSVDQSKAMMALTHTTGDINKMLVLARKDPHFAEAEFEERRRQGYLSLLSTKENEEYHKALESFTEEDKIFFEIGRRVERLYRQAQLDLTITDDGKNHPVAPRLEELHALMAEAEANDYTKLSVAYPYYTYHKISYEEYIYISGIDVSEEEAIAGRSTIADFFLKNKSLQEKVNSLGAIIPKELSMYDESKSIPLTHHYHGVEATVKVSSIKAFLELSKLNNLNEIDWVERLSKFTLRGIMTCNSKTSARIRADWNDITHSRFTTEEFKLLEAIRLKFDTAQGGSKELENLLVKTGDSILYCVLPDYAGKKFDSHMGVELDESGVIVGENVYGELLMRVRSEILKRREGKNLYSPSFLKRRRAVQSEEELKEAACAIACNKRIELKF